MSRRLRRLVLAVLAAALAAAGSASAYFTALGTGHASVSVGTLAAPSITGASTGAGTVALSWSAVTPPSSGSVAYYVRRDNGAASAACPGAGAPSSVTSCTDTGVTAGTHTYTVTAVWRSWTATSAGRNVTLAFGAASQLVFTTQPAGANGGSAFATQPVVVAEDAGGNVVTTYTGTVSLTIKSGTGIGGATLSGCSGVLSGGATTFSGCKIDKAGSGYQLHASDGALSGDSAAFAVAVGSVAQLAYTQQPAGATGGSAFATQPKVTAQDAGGNTVTTYAGTVALSIKPGTGAVGATLSGCSGALASGVTTFSGCKIDKVGTAYQLTASDGTRSVGSAAFDVTAGPVAALLFTQQPAGATGGTAFSTQPKVTAQDAGGNTATTSTGTVTLTLRHNTGTTGATLSGCSGVLASGVTTFSGCKIDLAGTAYKLTASDGTRTVDSAAFDVTVGPVAQLLLSPASTTPTAGAADKLSITAADAGGNTVTTYTGAHSLTFGGASNSPNGTRPTVTNSSGTAIQFGTATSIGFSAGVAQTSGVAGTMVLHDAETPSVTVTDGTISNGAGTSVTVSPGAGANLAWTHVTVSAGALSTPCLFTCTVSAIGPLGTFTANVSVTDVDGNTASGLGGGNKTVTVTNGTGSGSFTAPTAGTSVTLTIRASGVADSTAQFTFRTQSGTGWTTNTFTATASGFASATATLQRT